MQKARSIVGLHPGLPGPETGPGNQSVRRQCMILSLGILLLVAGCLFRKDKAAVPEVPPAPSRLALLPLGVSQDDADSRWLALAAPVLLAKAVEASPDLEVVPLWQSVPILVEALGPSRTNSPEVAAYVASRVAAKWATSGEFTLDKEQTTILLDFVPARATLVPYRYSGPVRAESLPSQYREAVDQFLRYLAARPLPEQGSVAVPADLREIAQALDREYGWFGPTDPGKAQKAVSDLLRTDAGLARLLFSPTIYPELASPASRPKLPDGRTPAIAPGIPTPPPPPQAPPPGSAYLPYPTESPPHLTRLPLQAPAASTPAVAPPPTGTLAQIYAYSIEKKSSGQDSARRIRPARLMKYETKAPADSAAGSQAAPAAPLEELPRPEESGPPSGAIQIQVFATRNQARAEALTRKLQDLGYAPVLAKTELATTGVWYRVRLGGYSTRHTALATGEKLRTAGLISELWLVR